MSITPITTVEEIAHPETEAHMMENIPQTPDTEEIPLTNNKRTIYKDLGVTQLLEIMATAKTVFQIEEDSNTKKIKQS